MYKIHLDTDIGGDIDDLGALVMLLKMDNVQITGVTTVAEENGKRAGYARYILNLVKREDILVKSGADVSGGFYSYKPRYPKEENYWPEPIRPLTNPIDEALELLKDSIEQKAVIVCIGQFTNLYLLDQKYPGILRKAKLFLMGGLIFPPRDGYVQWGNDMDYNIQLDTKSAKYVFENSTPTVITMAVTLETFLRRAYLEKLKGSDVLGKLLARQTEAFAIDNQNEEKLVKGYRNVPNDTINFLYDPLACAIALGFNKGLEIKELTIKCELKNNLLVEKVDSTGNKMNIVTKIDGKAFSEHWFNIVSG